MIQLTIIEEDYKLMILLQMILLLLTILMEQLLTILMEMILLLTIPMEQLQIILMGITLMEMEQPIIQLEIKLIVITPPIVLVM